MIEDINVLEYEARRDSEHILVDVREVDEFEAGHLPGAVNIPLSELQDRYDEIPEDIPVYLVCKTGVRSFHAAQFLMVNGDYEELINLNGGTWDWAQAGKPIEY